MSRRANIDPPTRLELKLPESVRTKLDLLLYSELEKRVPQGRYQAFFLERLTEFFEGKKLDLEQFGFAAGTYVSGTKPAITALEKTIKHQSENSSNWFVFHD